MITGTDVLAYLKAMRDHFGNAKIAWWKDYYDLENVTKNITQWNCTEMEAGSSCLGDHSSLALNTMLSGARRADVA